MEKAHRGKPRAERLLTRISLARGVGWGLIGGLAGTMVMDLCLMGALSAVGLPALSCFSIVGDTVARLVSRGGLAMTGDIPTGAAAHYLIGPAAGAVYGALVARVDAFRAGAWQRNLALGILYIEILSQPLLATAPILLEMTASDTLQWYSGSFVMHMVLGATLGAVVGNRLRPATGAEV
jgi:hypothetical protein